MSQAAFTCITCHVVFTNAEVQRLHYKSDWHRYNLKRKVVGLPPVSVQSFQDKVAAQQALVASNQSQENVVGVSCKLCQRKFSTFNAHKNHLLSKKHREAEAKQLKSMERALQEQAQAHIEKSLSDETDELVERQSINKALTEAHNNMKQPSVIRSDEQVAKDKDDNPRLRWYQKQVKAIKEREEAEQAEEDEKEEWEDLSDDEETIADESDSDDMSQTESNCTDNSSLSGIMAKVKLDSDADVESLLSENTADQFLLGPKDCFFCPKKSSKVENNVSHMSKRHGFFIPELEYLTDLKGLLTYLGEKVGMGNVCLWCNEKGHPFYSLRAVRHHMKDKGHCKMFTDGDASMEYADFYDFSSSYPDSDDELDDDDMSLAIPDVVHHGDDEDETELVLPSGAKIGHRSLMKYYKQNFPPIERFHHRTKRPLIDRLMAQYRAIGWHGYSGTAVMKKHQRDIRYVQKMKSKYMQQLGVKNNKIVMGRVRPQVIF